MDAMSQGKAILTANFNAAVDAQLEAGSDLNFRFMDNSTLVHHAACHGYHEVRVQRVVCLCT